MLRSIDHPETLILLDMEFVGGHDPLPQVARSSLHLVHVAAIKLKTWGGFQSITCYADSPAFSMIMLSIEHSHSRTGSVPEGIPGVAEGST